MRRVVTLVATLLAIALGATAAPGPVGAVPAAGAPQAASSGVVGTDPMFRRPLPPRPEAAPAPPSFDSTVVVHGLAYPDPEQYGLLARDCNQPTSNQYDPETVLHIGYTTDPAPLGLRMQGFDLTGGMAGVGPYAYTAQPGTASWTIRLGATSATSTGHAVAFYYPNETEAYMGHAPVSRPAGGWGTVDAQPLTLTWWRFDLVSSNWTAAGSATLSAFVAAKGGDGMGGYLGFALGCDGSPFWFDHLRVGPPGSVTTYDYEGLRPVISMDSVEATTTAGRRTVLRGSIDTTASGSYFSLELVLEARPVGSGGFTEVGRGTSTYDPATGTQTPVKVPVRPTEHTEYRWVVLDSPTTEGTTSTLVGIQVRSAAQLLLERSTVRKGKTVVATGWVTPARGQVLVTLQRQVGSKWRALDRTATKANGSYKLTTKATEKGTWKLRTLVAATATNLKGTSKTRKLTVR